MPRKMIRLKKLIFQVKPTGGMPEPIFTRRNNVTSLFAKSIAGGQECRYSYKKSSFLKVLSDDVLTELLNAYLRNIIIIIMFKYHNSHCDSYFTI